MSRLNNITLVGLESVILAASSATPYDQYLLKDADGLGPPEMTLNIKSVAAQGPSVYQGKKPKDREIVLRVELNPDYPNQMTPAQLRSNLYYMLGFKNSMQISLNFDGPQGIGGLPESIQTYGYIRRIEPVLFTKTPTVQITITCPSPYFSEVNTIAIPFTNGNISSYINGLGTAPAGLVAEITLASVANQVVLGTSSSEFNDTNDLLVAYSFLAGDKITFNTIPGSKKISLRRGLTVTNITGSLLSNYASWGKVYPIASNTISCYSINSGSIRYDSTVNAYYTPLYWGI